MQAFLSGWALHSGTDLPSREDKERHCSVNSASSPSKIAARLWVRAHPSSGATQTSKCTSPCLVKTWKTTTQIAAESWANVVRGDPLKDMTVVPPPAAPPATVESNFTRREPMDTTCTGASLSLTQDRVQVATLPSPASSSWQMDTSSFGAALVIQVPNSTQAPLQISLSLRTQTTSCHQCSR